MTSSTPMEKAFNRLLSLYLMSKAWKSVDNFGSTKLQKFVFLSEWKMINKRDKGFSYFYLRYKKGPFSFELNNDLAIFLKTGIVRRLGYDMVLTRYGECIVEDFSELLGQNECATSIITDTVDTYAKYTLSELLDEVYSLPHPYVSGYTIGTATQRMPLLYKLPDEKVRIPLDIKSEQAENLLFNLGTTGLKHWQAVREDMRNPECLTYREVFGEC